MLYYNHCVAATNNVHTMGGERGKKTDAGSLPSLLICYLSEYTHVIHFIMLIGTLLRDLVQVDCAMHILLFHTIARNV